MVVEVVLWLAQQKGLRLTLLGGVTTAISAVSHTAETLRPFFATFYSASPGQDSSVTVCYNCYKSCYKIYSLACSTTSFGFWETPPFRILHAGWCSLLWIWA